MGLPLQAESPRRMGPLLPAPWPPAGRLLLSEGGLLVVALQACRIFRHRRAIHRRLCQREAVRQATHGSDMTQLCQNTRAFMFFSLEFDEMVRRRQLYPSGSRSC